MKTTTLSLRALASSLALLGLSAAPTFAIDVFTDPVGYYTLSIQGNSDNVMSLPMVRDAVAVGTVQGSITANSFNVLAGQSAPTWTAGQWVYTAGSQAQTYFVEFTSGSLKGLTFTVTGNAAASLTVDTEGDSLTTSHSLPGNAAGALAVGDSFKIRPFWRIKDVFEVSGSPIIAARPNAFTAADEILLPNFSSVGVNKAAELTVYYVTGQGWRAAGQGSTDFGDRVLRQNEAFIVRRRAATAVNLTNLGGVLMNRSAAFVFGGNATTSNDTYISIARPAPVSLNASGLRIADQSKSSIKDSPSTFNRTDELYAFGTASGFNPSASATYYYLAGQGWRQVGSASTTVGDDVLLQPGTAYIVRKKAGNAGTEWVNDANY